MHIQQVTLTLMSFSAARAGSLLSQVPSGFVVSPPTGNARIIVSAKPGDAETWYVRCKPEEGPSVYFPDVRDASQLKAILDQAWDRPAARSRVPVLSRFIEPPRTPPPSASPPRQRSLSPQTRVA